MQCVGVLAATLLSPMLNGTSIAKPAVVAHRTKGNAPSQYDIEVINITSYPAYLIVLDTPTVYINQDECEVVLSTQANDNDFDYSYSPELRLLRPNERTTFKWLIPSDLVKTTRCEEVQLSFRVAYLLNQPEGILTRHYVAAHQILTESEAERYP